MSTPRNELLLLLQDVLRQQGAEMELAAVESLLGKPPRPEMGDAALPAFPLARLLRKAPPAIAAELGAALTARAAEAPMLRSAEAAGPYVNLTFDRGVHARAVVEAASAAHYGDSRVGAGQTVGIDYSAPNIAKPFGIGHLRSTVIGESLRRLHEAQGYRVVGVNHIGDWGTQFGKLMHAFETQGDEAKMEADPIGHLYDLYVAFHKAAAEDPTLEERGREWFRRLEAGEEGAVTYWKRFRDLSLREFRRIYDRLGVSFDEWWGEAFYNDKLGDVVRELEEAGLLEESEGARVVHLDELDMPPCLILKKDGASLYATRDLAAARWRHEQLSHAKFLYVVGAAQSVHFQQVFAVLKKLGHAWAEGLEHVPFGMILGISTRKGTLVFLEDVLDRGRDLALEVLESRENLSPEERRQIADQVAVGAVVFADLSRNRMRDYDFDWDRMLDWNGRTGPYLQYTHVRLRSLESTWAERGAGGDAEPDYGLLSEESAVATLALLERFPEVIAEAVERSEPSLVARYLLDVAESFNTFYSGGHRVIGDDPVLSTTRMALVRAVRATLGRGLYLLNIPIPERM